MSKLTLKRKQYFLSKQRRSLKQIRRRKNWVKQKNRLNNQSQQKTSKEIKHNMVVGRRRKMPVTIKAPVKFSLICFPEEVLAFFELAKKYLDKKVEIMLDFSGIELVTPDAIAILLAKVSNVNFTNRVRVYGNRPNNPEIDKIFKASGYYKIVGIDKSDTVHGIIHTKRNTIVDREIAVNARKLASSKTYNSDQKLQPLYRTLIECMANTKKHAKRQKTIDETWWLAVFNNDTTKITSFSFIDTGVGIFKSAKIQNFTKFALKLRFCTNIDILKDLIEGKIPSSTGLKHRGKGIPKIYNDFKEKNLFRLHIIANNVYANLEDGIFIELKHPLNGTFYYWEILPPITNENYGSNN